MCFILKVYFFISFFDSWFLSLSYFSRKKTFFCSRTAVSLLRNVLWFYILFTNLQFRLVLRRDVCQSMFRSQMGKSVWGHIYFVERVITSIIKRLSAIILIWIRVGHGFWSKMDQNLYLTKVLLEEKFEERNIRRLHLCVPIRSTLVCSTLVFNI